VIVENKAGAKATSAPTRCEERPDGHTLLMGGNARSRSTSAVAEAAYIRRADFEPISRVATQPNCSAVNPRCR